MAEERARLAAQGRIVASQEEIAAATGMMDILDVIEAMGAQFHEHQADILAWSWKLFCSKWARLIVAAAKLREQERQREAERSLAKLQDEHKQHWG